MPLQNGLEATEEIRVYEKENHLKRTPISLLTANVIKGAREKSMIHGVDDFLGKPIILKELERVFESFLSSKNMPVQKSFDLHGLQDELQLDYDQLQTLMKIDIKKMEEILPKLKEEIEKKAYGNISKLAHSIKGSSANFRLQEIQDLAHNMEKYAKEENTSYMYEECIKNIESLYQKIKTL